MRRDNKRDQTTAVTSYKFVVTFTWSQHIFGRKREEEKEEKERGGREREREGHVFRKLLKWVGGDNEEETEIDISKTNGILPSE